ncbi:hypothetical protein GW7_21829 [Heterocephalus glaber]|uniref:Uncharacterized protein n=1 Tax=Heterocephalus glaber TaxID=10181 RepID=G5BA50_HETGA|nr:hypothetical protein GW7_21829 [Heterocephalus glaber]
MECSEDNLSRISELPAGWTQECMLQSMGRSLQQIFQHVESARLSLMELDLPESKDVTSSNTSLLKAQEAVPPCCVCEQATYSTDHSTSSGSSRNSSSLSYLPAFIEGTTWQFWSDCLPVSHRKQPSVFRNQGTSLPQGLRNQNIFSIWKLFHTYHHLTLLLTLFEPPNVCKQEEKTKNKRRSRNHLLLDYGPNSVLSERPRLPGWALARLSPLARGELDGHLSSNVSSSVQKSWAMIKHLSTEQSVVDLPEERIQQPSTQVTNMELTPRLPYKVKDNIKITPLALLQVMASMMMIPQSHLEVTKSVTLFPHAPNQAVKPMAVMETMHVTPKPPNQITESVEVTPKTQQQVVE